MHLTEYNHLVSHKPVSDSQVAHLIVKEYKQTILLITGSNINVSNYLGLS